MSNEAQLVTLVICAIRYGINRKSIISYLSKEVQGDSHVRETCILRALEINEIIEKQYGKAVLPVALIVEIVRNEYSNGDDIVSQQKREAVVVRTHRKSSPNEINLDSVGTTVEILDEANEWVFVETQSGISGWIPRDCLVDSSNTVDI